MPKWNLKQLGHFVAVAQAPSLSHAARAIGMSQPALTASIRSLEERLGVRLFDRADGFRITPVGSSFLSRARTALAQMRDLDREMQLLRGGESGGLCLGCGPTMADSIVGPAMARMVRRSPGVGFSVVVREYHQLPAMLRNRDLELLVVDISMLGEAEDLEITPLAPQEIVLFCRSGHPLARKRKVTPEQFFSYPLAAPALPPWAAAWLKQHSPGSHPRLTVECSHHAMLKAVVEGSDAISGAPFSAIEAEITTGRLAIVRLEAPPLLSHAGIVRIRHRTLSPPAEMMMEELLGGKRSR